jgi:hypothetical protein
MGENNEENKRYGFNPGKENNTEKKSLTRDELGREESGGESSNHDENLYNPNKDQTRSGYAKRLFWGNRRRKQVTLGGGLVGILLGGSIFGLTFFGGTGFEFIHISQLMQQFHLSNQQNLQDGDFVKMMRFAKDVPNGAIERTRMGFLGNKFADYYEGKLNASGLTSAYTDKFGYLDGYVVDTDQASLQGLSGDDLKAAIADQYEVNPDNVVIASSETIKGASSDILGDWVIEAASLHFRETYALNYNMLRQTGLGKVSAAIGTRFMCIRDGCDWHPLSNLIGENAVRTLEEATKVQDNDESTEETGVTSITPENTGGNPSSSDSNQSVDQTNVDSIDSTLGSVATEAKAANTNDSALSLLSGGLQKNLLLGGTSAIAVLCILKGIDEQADSIKLTEVELPLIRMGVQAISIGSQIEDGQDVNAYELSAFAKQLYGTDEQGQLTDWSDSQSIQANMGNKNVGEPPDSTLTSIDQGSPFSFVNNIPGIGEVCSTAGQIIGGVLSFAVDFTGIGALVQTLVKGIATATVIHEISGTAAHWLAGKAVDVAAVGADFGNDIDFGSALAANQQAVMSGGTALTPGQSSQIQAQSNLAANQEFEKQSLVYKLFSIDTPKSLISNIIGQAKPTISANIEAVLGHFPEIIGSIFKIPQLLFSSVSAQSQTATTTGYNYPFPTYGFDDQDLDNPIEKNPFENAEYVSAPQNNILYPDSPYISRASGCFGVDIVQVNGLWDVEADPQAQTLNPYSTEYSGLNCNEPAPADCTDNTSDACNWLRIRFFILDTETMSSMGCYAGDDQACTDMGF